MSLPSSRLESWGDAGIAVVARTRYTSRVTTLVLTSRHTADDQALWRAAVRRGWSTVRVRGIAVPEISDEDIVIYAEALFAPTIAERLHRALLEPPDDWLVRVPSDLKHRSVRRTTLGEARRGTTPTFVKPPNDKSFTARVFRTGRDLPEEYDAATPVLVADPVQWISEYRCFCVDEEVVTVSPYVLDGQPAIHHDDAAPSGELMDARTFAGAVLRVARAFTPRAIVIDVGIIEGRGWAVVEANGAWGAGIYGCDPDGALDVVACATVPLASPPRPHSEPA